MMTSTIFDIPRWIMALWVAVLSVVVASLAPNVGATNHDHGDPRYHNKNIHDASIDQGQYDEDYCTEVIQGTLSQSSLRTNVTDALKTQSPRWQGAGSGKLDFYITANKCSYYGSRPEDRYFIELEYMSYATKTGAKWCNDGVSCVSHLFAVSGPKHQHFRKEALYMEQDHVDAIDYVTRQMVSHETGHAVGFRDPVATNPCPSSETPSIMHIPAPYGCADPGSGPTSKDLSIFANHIASSSD